MKIPMNKQVLLKLLVGALLCAAVMHDTQAQTNTVTPNAPAPGRGGGRAGIWARSAGAARAARARTAGSGHRAAVPGGSGQNERRPEAVHCLNPQEFTFEKV